MFKYLTMLFIFMLSPVMAEPLFIPPGAISVPQAQALVVEKCAEACVIIDAEDYQALQARVAELQEVAQKQGFAEGIKAAKDNPKICPRNL